MFSYAKLTMQNKTKQNKTKQNKTKQNKTKQKTKQNKTKHSPLVAIQIFLAKSCEITSTWYKLKKINKRLKTRKIN